MVRKILSINFLMSSIFLLTTVFPLDLFAYETSGKDSQIEKVDESLGYKPVVFKKARCPRCGMELYYIPGKESPHAHWVHYEVSEGGVKLDEKDMNGKAAKDKIKKYKDQAGPIISKKKKEIEDLKKSLREAKEKQQALLSDRFGEKEEIEYELRLKITCPYDGYSFFPEGDIIEEKKLMDTTFYMGEMSVLEASFSKSIPFGVAKDLKQFGYDLFEKPEEKERREQLESAEREGQALGALGLLRAAFSPTTAGAPALSFQAASQTAVVPISPDYVIGPGDMIVINIWGSVQESFPVEVDREGKIMLPRAGPLYVWGMQLKEAEGRIKQRLDQYYTNFSMDLSMGKLREIQVYVMGEVKKPGAYRINSQASIFQALYAAEGPIKLGSLRKIMLIHGDGKSEEIDLYPFLLEGKMVRPARIQSGDTIFVPAIGNVVAIAGNVKRPAIYETKSEISLQDLMAFAGGVTPTGDLRRLQVERIQNNERRVMLDIELKHANLEKFSMDNIDLRNGDIVMVSPIVRLKHDFVSIIGNVERPGDYALQKDMAVSSVLNMAKGFLPGTHLDRAEIARVTKDRTRQIIPVNLDNILLGAETEDITLEEWDILLVYSESQVQPPSFDEVDGAVNRPGRYELTPRMKISDLIFIAGGIEPGKVIRGAELFHIMPGEQPVIREVGVRKISEKNVAIDKDIILRASDSLFIKSEPRLTERRVVSVKGEVKYPGTYSIREGERLSSLIERAGGFTGEAFLEGTVFTRKSIREAQEKMRERFMERENKTILEEQQSLLLRRESGVDKSVVSESLKIRREMLESIQEAGLEGRMVISLKPVSSLKDTKYDILLEDGDALTVPQFSSAIAVIGSVNYPASVRFEQRKGIEYYIRKAGGLTKHADKAGIYVIRANGEALSKFMMSRRIERGDAIVVPQEFKYWTPPGQLLRDTVEILSRIAIGVGIIAALD